MNELLVDIEQYSKLLDILYTIHGTGGKLHIITDDGNIEDRFISHCKEDVENGDDDPYLKHVQLAILSLLSKYPEDSDGRYSLDSGILVEFS